MRSRMKNISVSASAAVVCLLTAIGSVGADYQGIPSNTLDTGVDIETRYRVYININSGDKVSGIFGGTVEPLMISSIGGVVIFQSQDLQWPKSVNDALFGFSTSLVDLRGLFQSKQVVFDDLLRNTDFTVPGVRDRRGRSPFRITANDRLPPRARIGNLNIYSFSDPIATDALDTPEDDTPPDVIPAPGVLVLLGIAGIVRRRRRI